MEESLDMLRRLLVESIIGEIVFENGARHVYLKETSHEAKLKSVIIRHIPEKSLLVKLDGYKQPVSLFSGSKGERKRCDYILFTLIDGKGYALFIELKSKTLKKTEYAAQFKGAECVIDYCHAALKRFYNYHRLIESFNRRFFVFYKPPSIAKQRTRLKLTSGNTSPDKAMHCPVSDLSLKKLLAL